jgi:hypothetical protein
MLLVQVPKYCDVPINQLVVPLVLASISAAWIETPYWGTLSSVVGSLMISTLLRSGPEAGIPLAGATVLKLFPGLLFVPLLLRRRAATWVGLAGIVMTTAVGMALYGVSLVDAVELLGAGSTTWLTKFGNVSLVSFLAGPFATPLTFALGVMVGIGLVAVYALRRPISQSLALAIPVSVLVSPVSWVHYDVVLIPLVIWLWTRVDYSFGRYAAASWLLFEAFASFLAELGQTGLVRFGVVAIRLAVAVAIAVAPARLWTPSLSPKQLQLVE